MYLNVLCTCLEYCWFKRNGELKDATEQIRFELNHGKGLSTTQIHSYYIIYTSFWAAAPIEA